MGCPSVNVLLSLVNKKLIWPIARQNRARQEIQAETQGKRRQSQGDVRCEVTSHEPCGKITEMG